MNSERILCPGLEDRIMSAQEAASFITSGMTVGMSGFSTSNPKEIPLEMIKHANNLSIIQGAGLGTGMLDSIIRSGSVSRYAAFQWGQDIRRAINNGSVAFTDVHLGQLSDKIRSGFFGKIDFAIIQCCKIDENGGVVPALSAGISNVLIEQAEKVLLELNLSVPAETEVMFDFCKNNHRPLSGVLDRTGETSVRCDPNKIAGIVITNNPEEVRTFRDTNALYQDIAGHIVRLLNSEIGKNRFPRDFTMQVGFGGVANAVLQGLSDGGFKDLKMYTEVLSDGAFDFVTSGLVSEASTTTLDLSPKCLETFIGNIDFYRRHIVIRPLEISNGVTQIASMGLVAMNTAVEADIYGNVNSTNAIGTRMLNGIGGSNDFCRSAKLSIFLTPSTAKDGDISSIVPMVSHVDNTEHDVDIIVTEYGYADLRGKSPKERAAEIIDKCAHPDYRQPLRDYFNGAVALCGPCQTPHDLSKALSWHQRFLETGTMKETRASVRQLRGSLQTKYKVK